MWEERLEFWKVFCVDRTSPVPRPDKSAGLFNRNL
jgi:hypothetical protein